MSILRTIGLAVFTVVAWSIGFAWMLVGALGSLALLLVGVPYQKVHHWITAPIFSTVTDICLVRIQVDYHSDLKRDRPSVYTQNHVNLLDGMVAARAIPQAFSGIMNAWQFHIPIYGWLMRLSKGIAVHRKRRGMVEELSRQAAERKRIGMSVLTFPEAHRTLDGKVRPFRRGVFLMARNAGMPVVPIAVRGLFQVNNKGTRFFHPFRRVTVQVGQQFETEGLDDDQVKALAEHLYRLTAHYVEHGEWLDEPFRPDQAGDEPATSAARTRPT